MHTIMLPKGIKLDMEAFKSIFFKKKNNQSVGVQVHNYVNMDALLCKL